MGGHNPEFRPVSEQTPEEPVPRKIIEAQKLVAALTSLVSLVAVLAAVTGTIVFMVHR